MLERGGGDWERMDDKNAATKFFIAGWLAGIGQVFIGQPFDAVKVRLQTNAIPSAFFKCLRNLQYPYLS